MTSPHREPERERGLLARLKHRWSGADEATRDRLWLTGAAVTSVVVPFAVSPIWSRVYPVEDFAVSALVQLFPGLITTWATLAYHAAIHSPREDEEAFHLVALSIVVAGVTVLLTLGGTLIAGDWIANRLLRQPATAPWLWAAPLLLLGNVVTVTLDQWMIRRRLFRPLGLAMAGTSVCTAIVPAFGLLAPDKTNFLLLGTLTGTLLGCSFRIVASDCVGEWLRRRPRRPDLMAAARQYANFPRDAVPSSILTNLATQLPQLMMGRSFDSFTAGQYARATTMVGLPVTLLGQPISAIFAQEGAKAYRERGDCRPEIRATLKKLLWTYVPVYTVLIATAPWLFPWFYGGDWVQTGRLAQPMMTIMVAAAIGTPTALVLNLGRLTKYNLMWQVGRIILVAASLAWGVTTGDPVLTLWILAGTSIVTYVAYVWLSWHFAVRTVDLSPDLPQAVSIE